MPRTIVFDVNETLLDVRALAPLFGEMFGDSNFLKEWFSLLLLHSQAATLAGPYFDFSTLAGAALDMMAAVHARPVQDAAKQKLLDGILHLPPHPEVADGLRLLKNAGLRLVTLSNSSQKAVVRQIRNAGLEEYFDCSYSVDEVQRYKPAPEPYKMVASHLGLDTSGLRLVAAHAWDILGAMRAGCAGAFVARPGQALFPLVDAPDVIGTNLLLVAEQIVAREAR